MLRLLVLTSLVSLCRADSPTSMASSTAAVKPLKSVNFEVYGKVQGVFFRKYTKQEAEKLGLKGWVLNTSTGSVRGYLEGPMDKIHNMMQWLQSTGSPSSQIDKAEFSALQDIDGYSFDQFLIRKDVS